MMVVLDAGLVMAAARAVAKAATTALEPAPSRGDQAHTCIREAWTSEKKAEVVDETLACKLRGRAVIEALKLSCQTAQKIQRRL